MLTAAQIVAIACEATHGPGKTAQALALLNSILSDLCEQHDFALARGLYTFSFNPNLTTNFGSGPYSLPLDYLRTSGSSGSQGVQKSSWWNLDGVPYPMVPVDLAEFDMQVQTAGQNSYPWLWATDMGGPLTDRIILSTTADIAAASTSVTLMVSVAGLLTGSTYGIAGEGITPGTTFTYNGSNTGTLSAAATATITAAVNGYGASLFFGIAPVGYAFPPPSGAYVVDIRYQRMMPPIVNTAKIPWFPNEGFLIKELTARLCDLNDDSRSVEMTTRARDDLSKYLKLKDDDSNRAQTVQPDRRVFGERFSTLQNTKRVGW